LNVVFKIINRGDNRPVKLVPYQPFKKRQIKFVILFKGFREHVDLGGGCLRIFAGKFGNLVRVDKLVHFHRVFLGILRKFHLTVGRDAYLVYVYVAGRVVMRGGDFKATILKRVHLLHGAFAERFFSDQVRPASVFKSAGDNFGSGGGTSVNQYNNGNIGGDKVAALRDKVLVLRRDTRPCAHNKPFVKEEAANVHR